MKTLFLLLMLGISEMGISQNYLDKIAKNSCSCVSETKDNFRAEKNNDISRSSIILSQPKHQTSDVLKIKDQVKANKTKDGTPDQPKPKTKLTVKYPITSKNDLIKDIRTALKPIDKNHLL